MSSMRSAIAWCLAVWHVCNCADPAPSLVNYYEDLIQTKSAEALNSVPSSDASEFETLFTEPILYGKYDYIVVGAGSAGAVMATRLTEIPWFKVLLLEAGGPEDDFTDIPAMMFNSHELEYNWKFNSTPQEAVCHGMINNECAYTRGKVIGGSSTINALMYVRGNRLDYDRWAVDNPGWSYKEVLPYFLKSEHSNIGGDVGYHNKGGYWHVEYHTPVSPQLKAFIDANVERGRKEVDYNGEEQLGVAQSQTNTLNGRRQSTGRAFLSKTRGWPNIEILNRSLATRVLIDRVTKKATGVVFSHKGKLYYARAKKEVILSGGVFGSAQLLMLSGVGPRDHLQQMGIPVIQDLAVGNNFHDHATYFGLNVRTNYTEPTKPLEEDIKEYLQGVGPLAIAGNAQGLGFYRTKLSEGGYPDIEIIFIPSNNTTPISPKAMHFTAETAQVLSEGNEPNQSFSMYVILLHPKSRGTVRLRSKNPYEFPLIDPRSLADPLDVDVMYEGIQIALDLLATEAFRRMNATLAASPQPPCRGLDYSSKEFWLCQMKMLTAHIFHPVGTCKMGPDPLKGAVVDHKLRVHGIANLRVVDASVMPSIISGHTSSPSVMIAEKVSDLVKTAALGVLGG